MNATDRKMLASEGRRGIAMLKTGDREGTIVLLRRLVALATGRDPETAEPSAVFHCDRLDGELTQQACLDRQLENERKLKQRRARAKTLEKAGEEPNRWRENRYRGVCPDHPNCITEHCAQGRAIRERLERDGMP